MSNAWNMYMDFVIFTLEWVLQQQPWLGSYLIAYKSHSYKNLTFLVLVLWCVHACIHTQGCPQSRANEVTAPVPDIHGMPSC